MTDTDREAFEAWAEKAGWPHTWRNCNSEDYKFSSTSWEPWQAATQRQQSRIAYVEKVADDAIELGNQQAKRIAELEADAALGRQMREAIGNESLARFIEKHGEPVPIMKRVAELEDAARINRENYEFQRNKADKATATVYQFHHAMKDAGWHPGRTDDNLCDIIRAKGKALAELEAEVQALRSRIVLSTSQTRIGYMCATDFLHELGEAAGGVFVFADKEDLIAHRGCTETCGVVAVEVRTIDAAMNKEGARD
jgi:hypothetical protein